MVGRPCRLMTQLQIAAMAAQVNKKRWTRIETRRDGSRREWNTFFLYTGWLERGSKTQDAPQVEQDSPVQPAGELNTRTVMYNLKNIQVSVEHGSRVFCPWLPLTAPLRPP